MKPDERAAHFGRRPAVSGDWALVRSGSVRAGRRQHDVVAYQVKARRRHQGSQFLEQLRGRQHQRCGTVGPGCLELKDEGLGVDGRPEDAGSCKRAT